MAEDPNPYEPPATPPAPTEPPDARRAAALASLSLFAVPAVGILGGTTCGGAFLGGMNLGNPIVTTTISWLLAGSLFPSR